MRLRLASFAERPLIDALGLASAALAAAERHGEPVLVTSLVSGRCAVLGALQRREESSAEVLTRRTTGPTAFVESLALHHALALPSLTSLASDATPQNLLNRYVRGFLRGYGKLGIPARYFGREYFSLGRRPCGLLGYDVSKSGAVLLEVFAGLDAPVLVPSGASSESPAALIEALGRNEPPAFAAAIHQGLLEHWSLEPVSTTLEPEPLAGARRTLGRCARRRVPIGWLEACASLDGEAAVVSLSGDVLTSSAAVAVLEERASAALGAGQPVDNGVLAPLLVAPLDGASLSDLEAVLGEAFALARAPS